MLGTMEIGDATPKLSDLEAVLVPLVPALERLQNAQVEQRRVGGAGDLSAMLAVKATNEKTNARVAPLGQRRQAGQGELEGELGGAGPRAGLPAAENGPAP